MRPGFRHPSHPSSRRLRPGARVIDDDIISTNTRGGITIPNCCRYPVALGLFARGKPANIHFWSTLKNMVFFYFLFDIQRPLYIVSKDWTTDSRPRCNIIMYIARKKVLLIGVCWHTRHSISFY